MAQNISIRLLFSLFSLLCAFLIPAPAIGQKTSITIHLRGVSETKITLLPLSGPKQFKSIAEVQGIKNGESTTLQVAQEYLPGEFVLRFDYKEKQGSTPYPSEKQILINKQDLELWASPMFVNNPDSTWFSRDERENAAFALFSRENGKQKEKLGLLQQFLMNYDDTQSKFYQLGTEEYEQRRLAYNQWLDARVKAEKGLFAGSIYRFSYVPQIPWEGSEKDRMISVIDHYFDGIDFNDPIIIRTAQMNEWMNSYVNLHGQMATTPALRDSLIPAAAYKAIEKAKTGHPLVYGWMVDYFYRGFESNDMPQGMKVLEPYLNDPACLTSKRMEIERRLKGIETLIVGSKAPDILLTDKDNNPFELNAFKTPSKYILILFWSADCSHCRETIDALAPWARQAAIRQQLSVVAISLDESEAEIRAWEQKVKELPEWKHLQAKEGINSKVANDYFILATPVMILLNAKTKEIVALPSTFAELERKAL